MWQSIKMPVMSQLLTESPPITYQTSSVLPFSQAHFYSVVSDVDSYSQFIPYMVSSNIFKRTSESQFEANTEIGFQQVSFEYTSQVTCKPMSEVKSISKSDSYIFKELYSLWVIEQ